MAIVDMLGKILVKNCNTPFTSMIEIFPHSFSFWSVTFWFIISLKNQQKINFPEIYFHWIEILNCFQSTGCFIIIAWAIAYVGFPTWITDRSMIFLTRCTGHESDLNEGRKGQTGPAAEESHCQVITCQHSKKGGSPVSFFSGPDISNQIKSVCLAQTISARQNRPVLQFARPARRTVRPRRIICFCSSVSFFLAKTYIFTQI